MAVSTPGRCELTEGAVSQVFAQSELEADEQRVLRFQSLQRFSGGFSRLCRAWDELRGKARLALSMFILSFGRSFALKPCRIAFRTLCAYLAGQGLALAVLKRRNLRPQVVFIKEVELQRAWSWQREVNALTSLKHPNIVTLLESPIHVGDCLHLVLEDLDTDLRSYIKTLKCPLSFVSLRPAFQSLNHSVRVVLEPQMAVTFMQVLLAFRDFSRSSLVDSFEYGLEGVLDQARSPSAAARGVAHAPSQLVAPGFEDAECAPTPSEWYVET